MDDAAKKMGLKLLDSSDKAAKVKYEVSCIRPDIMHGCDIAEEIGIGYGFNNIPAQYPKSNTVGSFIPINKFTDLVRHELAQAGYIECLTCALLSNKENYSFMREDVNFEECIQLSNPKTLEYEQVRTSLIPCLLKVLHSNQKEKIPQKIFEISDTAKIDNTTDTGAKNTRKVCLMLLNTKASFEIIHGALCLIMSKIGAQLGKDFSLKEMKNGSDKKFFDGRGAEVLLKGQRVGSIGVLHPEVLEHFQLKNPVSTVELDFEPMWNFFKD